MISGFPGELGGGHALSPELQKHCKARFGIHVSSASLVFRKTLNDLEAWKSKPRRPDPEILYYNPYTLL